MEYLGNAKIGDRLWYYVTDEWLTVSNIGVYAEDTSQTMLILKDSTEQKDYRFDLNGVKFYDKLGEKNTTLLWDKVDFKLPYKPLPDLKVDTKVLVWDDPCDGIEKYKAYFAHFDEHSGQIGTFGGGMTSWSAAGGNPTVNFWGHYEIIEDC
jgi:hypothetical protein